MMLILVRNLSGAKQEYNNTKSVQEQGYKNALTILNKIKNTPNNKTFAIINDQAQFAKKKISPEEWLSHPYYSCGGEGVGEETTVLFVGLTRVTFFSPLALVAFVLSDCVWSSVVFVFVDFVFVASVLSSFVFVALVLFDFVFVASS